MVGESILGAGVGMRDAAAVLCFRMLPPSVYAIFSTRSPWNVRLTAGIMTLWVLIVATVGHFFAVAWLIPVYGYLLLTCCCLPFAADCLRNGWVGKVGIFIACAAVFLVLPGMLLPGASKAAALVLGWDLMLRAHSYCVDSSKGAEQPLGDTLFFLLVNPVIVYNQRARWNGRVGLHWEGIRRIAWGIVVLTALPAALSVVIARLPVSFLARPVGKATAVPVVGLAQLLVLYCQQSGLADVHIGAMRQLGYVLPERFHRPLVAHTPADFWRRWNVYVGAWAFQYVFWPLSLKSARVRGSKSRLAARAAAVVVTFAALGLLHDAYVLVGISRVTFRGCVAFTASALIVVATEFRRERVQHALRRGPHGIWSALAAQGGLVAFWVATASLLYWWKS